MDSALRPRDIQSRIRHGESPDSVAQAARVTVEELMPYAGPVLAERAHVAQRAQRSSLRRRQPESSTSSRTLGDAVVGTLRREGADPAAVEWDAWRRDDGRWTLEAAFAGRRSGAARFIFDTAGNYVTLDNDDAKWLVGEVMTASSPAEPTGPRRLLTAVAAPLPPDEPADDQLTIDDELGADALDLVRDEPTRRTHPESPPSQEREAVGQQATRRPVPASSRRRGRASVPSWDEIMFGGQQD